MTSPKKDLPTLLPKTWSLAETPPQIPTRSSLGHDHMPPRRRRAVLNACDNCQRKKVRCDGTRPRCGPCARVDLQCHFAAPQGMTMQQADKEKVDNYQSVIKFLQEGSLEEATQALQRIREAENTEDAVKSIAEAQLLLPGPSSSSDALSLQTTTDVSSGYQSILRASRSKRKRVMSPYEDTDFMFDKLYMANAKDANVDYNKFVDVSSHKLHLSRWTTVSADEEYMNHLLNLFFTWDNIVEQIFYRPILEEDIAGLDPDSADDDPGAFCSRFLINSLLALSCLYTLDPKSYKDSEDRFSRGRRWADEADIYLAKIERPSIPLLQGLYALFCYEGGIGSGSRSVEHYLRAMDTYRVLDGLDFLQRQGVEKTRLLRERQAASWCMWGLYCSEWRISQACGFRKLARKPTIGKAWQESDFPLSQPACISYWRFPYPMSLQTQKSMQVEIREVEVVLSEIAEETLDFLHPEEGKQPPITNPTRALELYDAIADWKFSCPSRLRFEEAVLPSAILLHIYVEVMFTAILRPFSHLTREAFGRFNPRDRCYAHASNLMSCIWTFRSFSILRFEYYLIHAIGTAAYIVLRETECGPIQLDTLIRACQCLHEMRVSLLPSTDVLSGIHASFIRYKIPVPACLMRYFTGVRHRKDGLLHHAVAALLPSPTEIRKIGSGEELRLQELLDGLDDLGID